MAVILNVYLGNIPVIYVLSISSELGLRQILWDKIDDKSTLVQA